MVRFAGTENGRLFGFLPGYVADAQELPGHAPIPAPTPRDWLRDALMLKHMWASPNLPWSLIALAFYFAAPYRLGHADALVADAPLSWSFFAVRFPLWAALVLGYAAFWHATLYGGLGWARRPMLAARAYNWDKVAHNVFWSVSGVAIWVAFENVFVFLWSTGRLAYLSDADAFSTRAGALRFALGLVLMPLWRDGHFYFAHRLLHYKPMFQQVHSLHHRNTDVEPFAGLAMHPVEHLYYYACILPSLVCLASPFHFVWNGMHMLLAPAASHSGWEDHFQADSFHYLHHRYFEVNYAGANCSFLDQLFGTFEGKFREKRGEAKQRDDAKSTLRVAPTAEFVGYLVAACACVGAWAWRANAIARGHGSAPSSFEAVALALLAGFGPVAVACAMTVNAALKSAPAAGVGGAMRALLAPHEKRPAWEHMLHVVFGTVCCAVPISMACYLAMI